MAPCNSVRLDSVLSLCSVFSDPLCRTGHPQLMAVVRRLGMRTGKSKGAKNLVIECQVRSLVRRPVRTPYDYLAGIQHGYLYNSMA